MSKVTEKIGEASWSLDTIMKTAMVWSYSRRASKHMSLDPVETKVLPHCEGGNKEKEGHTSRLWGRCF